MPEKLAGGLIPKPTLWTFACFNNLRREAVRRDERSVILRREDGSYEGVLWNLCREQLDFLRQTAQPWCGAQSVQAADGWVHAEITLGINGVTHFT